MQQVVNNIMEKYLQISGHYSDYYVGLWFVIKGHLAISLASTEYRLLNTLQCISTGVRTENYWCR